MAELLLRVEVPSVKARKALRAPLDSLARDLLSNVLRKVRVQSGEGGKAEGGGIRSPCAVDEDAAAGPDAATGGSDNVRPRARARGRHDRRALPGSADGARRVAGPRQDAPAVQHKEQCAPALLPVHTERERESSSSGGGGGGGSSRGSSGGHAQSHLSHTGSWRRCG
jgi:hypothetical protein